MTKQKLFEKNLGDVTNNKGTVVIEELRTLEQNHEL
jgi:hypothetical protein